MIDLTPLIALLSSINPVYGAIAAAAVYFLGPKLVPLLQKLLAKAPGGVPVLPLPVPTVPPVVPVLPLPVPVTPANPATPSAHPILDTLGQVLLALLKQRATKEGKTVEAVLAEYVADETKPDTK